MSLTYGVGGASSLLLVVGACTNCQPPRVDGPVCVNADVASRYALYRQRRVL
jgi:hypothetical protein